MSSSAPSMIETRRDQIFPVLLPSDIERMRRFGEIGYYTDGQALIEAGKVGDGLFVFFSGRVEVTQHDALGRRIQIVTYLYTRDRRWHRTPPPGLAEALQAGDSGIVVTGTNVVGRELTRIFLHDSRVAVFLGLGLVAFLLWFDFKSLKLTAIALAQLVSGVLLMLGVMKALRMDINYANAFVATMIMGVGIDYAIHLVHRLHANGGIVDEGVLETGKGVALAAATNVAGFGTLAFGNYPAMRSVGIVALIGSLTCLLTALTVVPALMARQESK